PVPLVGRLLFPGAGGAVTPPAYTALFTSHGLIMIFFAITPIVIGGIGTFLVPRAIGSDRMALPRLTAASFWVTAAGQACALAAILAPGPAPSAGWTSYPPLASGTGAPGAGQTLMMVAIALAGVAAVLGAASVIATVATRRAPGMGWADLPLSVWGLFLTAALSALFAPVLIGATLLLLSDRLLGTALFGGVTGDPVLYQHMFWLFGHPEVYIVILPVWGVVGELVAVFAGRPPFWQRGTVMAMISVATMSGLVYGHHMFRAGLSPMVGVGFEALTLIISAPATLMFVNWMATLWRGSLRLRPPMLFALGTMAVLALGGLSGILLGAVTTDIWLHDTLWVVGHFHLIMAAAALLGGLAAVHYWFPVMFGRVLDERLARIHFAGTLVFSILTFGGLLASGYAGEPRRYVDSGAFEFLAATADLSRWTSYAAFALGAFQLLFLFDLVRALRRPPARGLAPWGGGGLEWTSPAAEEVGP
ncbi:MAG TPA: cbb3-type cytochrome c oxidase subunit I, partial [Kofleriaceae bacterium]|nr:cbb3-type cytochrome c oxidase subunit I [Kofleriaceae bacterium]